MAVHDADSTGLIFIGFIFNICLQGIMTTQVFLYFSYFKSDRPLLKAFVMFMFLADLSHSVFMSIYLYNVLILNFGNVPGLFVADWVFATEPALTGIIGAATQLFYARRVQVLTGKKWLAAIIAVCAVLECLAAIGSATYIHYVPNFIDFRKFKYMVMIWLISSAVADILITTSLVTYLHLRKRGFSNTDDLINKIMRLTVQTGLITTSWALVELILYLAYPTALHILFGVVLSKLYANSLMSTLNSRGGWKFCESTVNASSAPANSARMPKKIEFQMTNPPTTTTNTETGTFDRKDEAW